MHCPKYKRLYGKLKRVPEHDMDFVAYGKFLPLAKKLFIDLPGMARTFPDYLDRLELDSPTDWRSFSFRS